MRSRRGGQKAIMAVAHQLITTIFHIVRDGSVYQELGAQHYDQQNKPKITRKLVDRLQKLGYYVTLQPIEAAAPNDPVPVTDTAPAERRKRGRSCKCAERGIVLMDAENPRVNRRNIRDNPRVRPS